MSNNFVNSHAFVASVAVGTGVLVGAVSVFIYEHFFGEKRRVVLQQEVLTLGRKVSEIREELRTVRAAQRRLRIKNNAENVIFDTSSRTDAETEMVSAIGDDFDDEFFDLSDTEEQLLTLETAKRDFSGSKYDELDSMLTGNIQDKTKAYGLLLDLFEKDESNPDVLWRLAKACHFMADAADDQQDVQRQQYFLTKGIEFATKCLDIAPRSSDAHKWYAICIGARSKLQGTKGKIRDGIEFKSHVEEALDLNPDDAALHYLLGRFKYEVATLSWLERKVANALYGEVPSGTMPEAVESLTKAEELSLVPWKENRLLLAKCYLHMNELSPALHWLDKADEVEVISPEDRVADAEIKVLNKKIGHHRGFP